MCAELPQSNGTPQLDVSLGVSEADWIVQQDRLLEAIETEVRAKRVLLFNRLLELGRTGSLALAVFQLF